MRPKYRGVSHRIAFHISLVTGAVLVAHSAHRGSTLVYAILISAMFGVSATLHRADWSPRMYTWLRRADHATIFIAIAGTYTPFSLLGLQGDAGNHLLALAYIVCGCGVIRALAWPHAPRPITASCFLAAGWVVIAYIPSFHRAVDPTTFALIVAGGVTFTVGALIYTTKFPDPWPQTFGYHEVFHALTIVGVGFHYAAIWRLAT
ncbi:MAG: hemolysin III family protein [Kofleriaceae bacterium]